MGTPALERVGFTALSAGRCVLPAGETSKYSLHGKAGPEKCFQICESFEGCTGVASSALGCFTYFAPVQARLIGDVTRSDMICYSRQ